MAALAWLVLVVAPVPALGCSAGGRHPHYLRNTQDLFTFSSNLTKADQLCSAQLKGRQTVSCQVVNVNLQAFLGRSLAVPVSPDATVTNSVHEAESMEPLILVKRMELGLQMAIQDPLAPATAQVQYSGKAGNVIFVIKSRGVYVSLGQGDFLYSLEPCLAGHSRPDPACHLWVKAVRKKQKV